MVTEEQINETFRKIAIIRKRIAKQKLNESNEPTPVFNTVEDVCKYYNAEPLEEFDKKFRSGY